MWGNSKNAKSKSVPSSIVYFKENILFTATASYCSHTLASYAVDAESFGVLPYLRQNREFVNTANRFERRPERQKLMTDLFLGTPNFGIQLRAVFKTLPTREINLFNLPLSITPDLFNDTDPRWIVKNISEFVIYLGGKVEPKHIIGYGGNEFSEIDVLRSPHSLVKIYWISAITSKTASLIKGSKNV